ncbi:unnamed protein product [Adineta ricciae]|uniref:RRM domain-containing protein n=1 Tax=Adineta ricciae TaxID=249248 RepID=A0A815UEG5_ADIRI|nr:unnamed protein product [Adineta ricciae]CAF1518397.1 unnamed protein product [Adineta ricciae]
MLDQDRCSVIIHGVCKEINEKYIEKAVLIKIGPPTSPRLNQITCFLSFKLRELVRNVSFQQKLTEYDMQKYFNRFGGIIGCDHPNDHECIRQFQDYDTVDQIILENTSPRINGIEIDIEET